MKHRFIIQQLNHTFLLLDTTDIGLPSQIYPPEGKLQQVPTFRFQNWTDAERHLRELGAKDELLSSTAERLKKAEVVVLTMI